MRKADKRRRVFLAAVRSAENTLKYARRLAESEREISVEAIVLLLYGLSRSATSLAHELIREDDEREFES